MTRSRSTPRIRFIQGIYLLTVALVAVSDGRAFVGLPGEFVRLAALLCVAGAVLGRIWTSLFIAGRKDRVLVTEGPYSRCRHPLYLLSIVGALGIGLAARSVTLAIALPVLIAGASIRAVHQEESFLAHAHAVDWTDYAARVPRYWPRPGQYRAVATAEVPLPVYFKAFLDGGSLLALFVLVVAADLLATAGITPSLLWLP
jgi:protein-S-isoprenylcysteine O-methyltransferase Ste14